jgi:hypothetical protein
MTTFPVLMHTALDATDCRELAEFYRQFLGLRYPPTTRSWSGTGSGPRNWARRWSTTAPPTRVSPCTC